MCVYVCVCLYLCMCIYMCIHVCMCMRVSDLCQRHTNYELLLLLFFFLKISLTLRSGDGFTLVCFVGQGDTCNCMHLYTIVLEYRACDRKINQYTH